MASLNTKQFLNVVQKIQSANNVVAKENANSANEFSRQMQEQTMKYNSEEAEKNRQFQERLSNTSHQREIFDLKAAGLNPVLSANNGASVTSGSSASVGSISGTKADMDMQAASLYAQYYMQKINNAQQLKLQKINNKTAEKIANINAAASMYGANQSASASMYGSRMAYSSALDVLAKQQQFQIDNPQNAYQLGNTLLEYLFPDLKKGTKDNGKKEDRTLGSDVKTLIDKLGKYIFG